MEQARVAVCQAFGFEYKRQMSGLIPYGLYTIPEVSMVGESEDSLHANGRPYLVGRGYFERNARAQITGDTSGLIKLLFDPETRVVLGVHIIGFEAGNMIAEAALAMEFKASAEDIGRVCHAHPTVSEAVKEAALAAWDKPLHL